MPDGAKVTPIPGIALEKSDQTKLSKLNPWIALDAPLEIRDNVQENPPEPIKLLKEKSRFDSLTVWGHDKLPEADDPFVKGIEEWTRLARAIHVDDDAHSASKRDKTKS